MSPGITITRRVDWMDTDAAGIYHYTTAFRLAEAAEAALHTDRGIDHITFGATPRVSVAFDFQRPVVFDPGAFGEYGGPANGGFAGTGTNSAATAQTNDRIKVVQ